MSQPSEVPLGIGANADGDVELPRRNESEPIARTDVVEDLEAGNRTNKSMTKVPIDPSKLLDPIRTDPIKALELRKRRLDRQADSSMPEVHYVGQIVSGKQIVQDPTEGAFCRYT
jgi:hypothetical protein